VIGERPPQDAVEPRDQPVLVPKGLDPRHDLHERGLEHVLRVGPAPGPALPEAEEAPLAGHEGIDASGTLAAHRVHRRDTPSRPAYWAPAGRAAFLRYL